MGVRNFSICLLLLVSFSSFLSSCTKTDDTPVPVPEIEVPKPVKAEWRVKRTLTQSWNLKLSYGFDTADFEYDQRGRVTDLKYRLRAGSSPSSDAYTVIRHLRYEYVDTTEIIKRYMAVHPYGLYSAFIEDFTYDVTGLRYQTVKTYNTSEQSAEYRFHSYAGILPEKYTYYYSSIPGYWGDTSEFRNEYYNGLLVKKIEDNQPGVYTLNQFVTSYEYNEARNIKYTQRTHRGMYNPNKTDTIRQIYFTWKPSPSPNTNKLKRLPMPRSVYTNNGGGGLFYFDSYALLNEVDIFSLAANGQVLTKSRVVRLDHTNVNPGELNYEYELDANNNIGKIIGTSPFFNARFETTIEYEKIP